MAHRGYPVEILKSSEFDKLEGVQALPSSDRKHCHAFTELATGHIFVRDSGDAKKNEALISHELAEIGLHRGLINSGVSAEDAPAKAHAMNKAKVDVKGPTK